MNALTPTGGGGSLMPRDMSSAMQLANMMATGKLVPQHLQRSPGDCLMVIEQAMRWGMSPFAVAQCTGIVKGKLSYEGKLVAAAIHTSGILSGRLDYKFSGSGDDRKVVASGLLRGEAAPREVEVALKSARTDNEHWRKSPDQMLTYHAARVWARRHAPEVMLGVYSPEEFDREGGVVEEKFSGTTIEAEPDRPTMGEQIGDALPAHSAAPKRTLADVINELDAEFTAALTRDAVDLVLASEKCQKALDFAKNGAKERLEGIIKIAINRTETAEDNSSAATDDSDFPGDRPSREAA